MYCFFKQKTAYEMRISDWSSDVCSSDLAARATPKASPTRVRRFAVRASDVMQSPGLLAHHDGKPAALAHQLLGRTVFDDLALLDGDDAMGMANGRQAMRDNQHRPALADLLHVRLDRRLGFPDRKSVG